MNYESRVPAPPIQPVVPPAPSPPGPLTPPLAPKLSHAACWGVLGCGQLVHGPEKEEVLQLVGQFALRMCK